MSGRPEMDLWSLFFAAVPINLYFKHWLKLCFPLVFRRGSYFLILPPVGLYSCSEVEICVF